MLASDNILVFLGTSEICKLYLVDKQHCSVLTQKKAIKQSIWRGDLEPSMRSKFWIHGLPLYRVQQETKKCLGVSSNPYEYIHSQVELSPGLSKVNEEITKDLNRTALVSKDSKAQEHLRRVLLGIAYVKPSIGYCQGMNFLGAVILKLVRNEEVAFWVFLGMIKKFDMENMFVPGVPDIALREHQFNYYIENMLPNLYTHFRKIGVRSGFFISRWYMTLYSVYLPLETVFRVWDCFFLDGWKTIVKIGVGILKENNNKLLILDLEDVSNLLMVLLRETTHDYKQLLSKASQLNISNKELKRIENDYYSQQAQLKLKAIENTHSFTDRQIEALRWAKAESSVFDCSTKECLETFQKKIEKLHEELETTNNHYLTIGMEILKLQKELQTLHEKKAMYEKHLKQMQKHAKKNKNFFSKLKKSFSSSQVKSNQIGKQDIFVYQTKLNSIQEELKELQTQLEDKNQMYKDAKRRAEDIKEKKLNYSQQLCEFVENYKQKVNRPL